MKKLVFMFAAVVAVSFASCGGNTAASEAVDSDTVVVEDTTCCADSVCADTVAADTIAE